MTSGPKNPEWMPHVWEGANFFAFARLLFVNRFDISPRYWWVVAIATVVSFIHSVLWLIQAAFWRHRIARTPPVTDPIFILGHWRTGTTFLHELLICDPRFAYPNYYQCLEPNHFLLAERFVTWAMPFLLPGRRPMDDLPIGWNRPQEDEFALCLMGQPSFYTHIGFPNRRPADFDWLDFRNVAPSRQRKWSAALASFLRQVSLKNPGRRLVLKSPPHTARIPALLRQFPNATFVHIVRDPYRVFSSTVRMWSSLYHFHALQAPDGRLVENTVLEAGRRLYDALERDRGTIPEGRIYELKYEDLLADPARKMAELYRALKLGDFADAKPQVEAYLAGLKDYRALTSDPPADVRAKVDEHWGDIARRYGYGMCNVKSVTALASPVGPPLANTLSTIRPCTT